MASTVFTGMWAIVLAVLMSVGGAGAASSARVSAAASWAARSAAPSSPTAPTSALRAEAAPPGRVKIPGPAVSAPEAIAAASGRVWVANSLYPLTGNARGWVTELSAKTGTLIRVISAPRDGLTDPEAIAVAGNRVWVVNSFGSSVTELNAATGGLIRVIAGKQYQLNSGGFSVAIAVSGNRVWVPNANGDSVTEIDAASGALIRVIAGPRYRFSSPVEVAVSGNLLWVVSSTSDNSSVTVINARLLNDTACECYEACKVAFDAALLT